MYSSLWRLVHVVASLSSRSSRAWAFDGDVLPKDNRLEQTLRVIELLLHQLVKGRKLAGTRRHG